ncbi:MAG: peptidase caspase catalytic subunit p20 [Myxococcales bacterium]|nr:peptidase caspase catalytic subunit p20 [Myxococcales bacterium]
MLRPLLLLLLAFLAALPSAQADELSAGVSTYAVVVGSNAGGPGQIELRYAEEDARRMGSLLTELGGYPAAGVDVIVHPTPDLLRERLTRLGARVTADLAAGKKARVLFYYSGHARATALDLGAEQMPLAELRARLFSVPAQLTVVVLDACQSGAFSRVKGATPAADFSFNSRSQLDASGIAVLASSSGSELSQESEQLRSSYFTHHLLVGMRGAGDANKDGQVSIDEAYRYAYHQTLLATAETAVGGQHVSLEVDLKGHGEVPMSFPRAATSAIELPASLEGKTLVQDRRARAVVAETYKAKGAAVRIAVAPGEYEVLVRRGSELSRCQVIAAGAGGGVVDLRRCTTEAIVVATGKGGGFDRPTRIEIGLTSGPERQDGYTQTLRDFGFEDQGTFKLSSGVSITAIRQIERRLWVGASGSLAGAPRWRRADTDTALEMQWSTATIGGVATVLQPFARSGLLSNLAIYGRLGAGLAIATTRFTEVDGSKATETFFGPALAVAAGLHLESPYFPGVGMSVGYALDYARAINNEIGDTHASGGHRGTFALSYSY